jgi:hypothetical protein
VWNGTAHVPIFQADPTNLYLTNLPKQMDEEVLVQTLLDGCGFPCEVISCRVLRDDLGYSR